MTDPTTGAPLTPSQTIGPFFAHALPSADGPYVVQAGAPAGFWVRGQVIDGAGEPVTDALIETWQVEPAGFGRCPTDAAGTYGIFTVKPSAIDGQAPHIDVSVFSRGLLDRVVTRIYFPDEEAANGEDPVLGELPPATRETLIASPAEDGYTFNIRLQGEHESVFFAL